MIAILEQQDDAKFAAELVLEVTIVILVAQDCGGDISHFACTEARLQSNNEISGFA